jgi:choline dehydrogenase
MRHDRVIGVEAVAGGRAWRVPAGRVTLAAGGVNTPAILERSGIGATARLRGLGVEPAADLPGVGENLTDHPAVVLWGLPVPGVRAAGGPAHTVMARLATGGADPDLGLILALTRVDPDLPVMGPVLAGRLAAAVSVVLLDPDSRGAVHLRDAAPGSAPEIRLRLAGTGRDVERLAHGTRLAWSLLRSPGLADLLSRVFVWTDRMVADDALLASAVAGHVRPLWHPSGTARMGPAGDPMAVVDERCRVRGVSGLRVVDASVMPSIPRATPHLTCVMLAERVAAWMA